MASTRREAHLQARFPQTRTKFYRVEHPFAEGLLREIAETWDGVVIATVHYPGTIERQLFSVACW